MPVRAVLIAVALLAAFGAGGAEARPSGFPTKGVLVFACGGCPGSETAPGLFTIRTNGRSRQSLKVDGPAYSPVWSPDGRTVAYTRGFKSIWIAIADTSRRKRLTRFVTGWDTSPAWAPDGKRLVFVRTAPLAKKPSENRTALWVVKPDGKGLHRLLVLPDNALNPSWSPDGRWIAFNDARDRLYLARSNGTGVRRLGSTSQVGRMPRWSPDGRHIAFVDLRQPVAISVLDRATGRVRPLFRWRSNEFTASHAWSPDGKLLAVMGRRPVKCQVSSVCQRLDITLVRVSDGKRRTIFSRLNGEPYGIDWRHPGR